MLRYTWTLLVGATLVGCPSATRQPAPAPAGLTPVEQALELHGAELRALPGVLEVRASTDGLHADVCAEEAAAAFAGRELGVPLSHTVVASPDCGCTHEGRYFNPGQTYPVDCNTCRCGAGGSFTCTLLACDVGIADKVFFGLNSSALDDRARTLVGAVASVLAENLAIRLKIRGHSSPAEKSGAKLSESRARAVVDFLVAQGVDASRLEVVGMADGIPVHADRAKERSDPAVRRVEFEVLAR